MVYIPILSIEKNETWPRKFLGDERCKKFPRKCWKQIRLFGFYGYFMGSFSNENKIYMINNILDKKHLGIYILDITP